MNNENLHSRLLANLTTGIILLDQDLRLNYINLAAESLLAISGRQVHHAYLGEIFLDSEADIIDIRAACQGNYSFTKRKTELHMMHGKTLSVDYTITPLVDTGKQQVLMEIQALNYADRITKDEALVSTHETTRELVRGLAHEIKNPLGGIRGAAQLLASELPDPELGDYTRVIIEEADRLSRLVDQLVGYRKLPEMRKMNIHEVLERVHSLVEAENAGSGINLVRDYDPSIPSLYGDREQLIQAMLNIVRNAVQALEGDRPDEPPARIELKTRVLRNATISSSFYRLVCRVEIIDNGPGIARDLVANIFYPMISGRADGTGLGLSIAHAIVHQHQGLIECDSRPGRTRFTIHLPITEDSTQVRHHACASFSSEQ